MSFAQLALIGVVAVLGPLFSLQRVVRVPVVIGELGVGVVLGSSGVNLLDGHDPTFAFLADQIGFALVMFVAGSHVPIRSAGMRAGLRRGLLRACAIGVLAVPVGQAIAAAFGTGHGLLYAVLLASSSAAVVMPALDGLDLTAPAILDLLPQIAIADAACIVMLPLTLEPSKAPARAAGAIVLLAMSYLLYRLLAAAEASGWRRAVHHLSEERHLALELRISLILLFAMAALAQAVHVSVMVAGFVVGLTVAAVGEPRRLANQLFALTEGFFAPLFFVWLGASLDVRQALAQPRFVLLGLALGLGAALVHGLMAITGQPLSVAVTTCAQLGVPVAAASLGRAQGVLAAGEDAALVLGALATIVLTAAAGAGVARHAGQ
ncbi:MAG: cation:proton antiporter [Tetrasphaera sp.]